MPRQRPPLYGELSRKELNHIYAEIAARQWIDEMELEEYCHGQPVRTRKPKAEYL